MIVGGGGSIWWFGGEPDLVLERIQQERHVIATTIVSTEAVQITVKVGDRMIFNGWRTGIIMWSRGFGP